MGRKAGGKNRKVSQASSQTPQGSKKRKIEGLGDTGIIQDQV